MVVGVPEATVTAVLENPDTLKPKVQVPAVLGVMWMIVEKSNVLGRVSSRNVTEYEGRI